MPPLGFSSSIMGVVAYGEVKASDGTSAKQNSGQYATARLSPGVYTLTPSDGNAQIDNRVQVLIQNRDPLQIPHSSAVFVDDVTGTIYVRFVTTGNIFTDTAFTFTILRSTLPPAVIGGVVAPV